jgi:hypothetical protein
MSAAKQTPKSPTAQRGPHYVQRLVRHGFVQGERAGNQSGECNGCEKTVRRNRSWWMKTSHEYDEWDCYCKRCALEKAAGDEAMWNAYAEMPNNQAER